MHFTSASQEYTAHSGKEVHSQNWGAIWCTAGWQVEQSTQNAAVWIGFIWHCKKMYKSSDWKGTLNKAVGNDYVAVSWHMQSTVRSGKDEQYKKRELQKTSNHRTLSKMRDVGKASRMGTITPSHGNFSIAGFGNIKSRRDQEKVEPLY